MYGVCSLTRRPPPYVPYHGENPLIGAYADRHPAATARLRRKHDPRLAT